MPNDIAVPNDIAAGLRPPVLSLRARSAIIFARPEEMNLRNGASTGGKPVADDRHRIQPSSWWAKYCRAVAEAGQRLRSMAEETSTLSQLAARSHTTIASRLSFPFARTKDCCTA
ncbi:MAG: hypothetical protein ACK5D7_14080 [Planctomycetota bacterium]